MTLTHIYGFRNWYVPNAMKEIHAWFTGERKLKTENRSLTEQAVAVYLSAKLPHGLFYEYDPVCQDAKQLLKQAVSAGEAEALGLAVYVDMGLCVLAECDWEALPGHLQALYGQTDDPELKNILSDFPAHLKQFQEEREYLEMVVRVLGLREQGLPPDLGAHDPTYYGDE